MKLHLLAPLLLLGVSACAPKPVYDWGNYQQTLLAVQENPTAAPSYRRALAAIVDHPHGKVPPGIYAEYGYVLQQKGQTKAAIVMYEREKQAWPESDFLMNKMIAALDRQPPAPSQPPQTSPMS